MSEDEDLDTLCEQVDYHLVQEPDDAYSDDGVGYRFVQRKLLTERPALGKVRSPEPHETEVLACILQTLPPKNEYDTKRFAKLEALIKKHQLRTLWYYTEEEHSGETAYHAEARLTLDIEAIVNWLGSKKYETFAFSDNGYQYTGYALAWLGAAVPWRIAVQHAEDL